jgi:hypothetical protein
MPESNLQHTITATKTQSSPTPVSGSAAIPSILTPPRIRSPEASMRDLETGNEAIIKEHWWSRKRGSHGQVIHSEATSPAYAKSPLQIFKGILFSSWVNVLLVFIPVGIALHFVNVNPTVVFVMNFLAIVPLAGV